MRLKEAEGGGGSDPISFLRIIDFLERKEEEEKKAKREKEEKRREKEDLAAKRLAKALRRSSRLFQQASHKTTFPQPPPPPPPPQPHYRDKNSHNHKFALNQRWMDESAANYGDNFNPNYDNNQNFSANDKINENCSFHYHPTLSVSQRRRRQRCKRSVVGDALVQRKEQISSYDGGPTWNVGDGYVDETYFRYAEINARQQKPDLLCTSDYRWSRRMEANTVEVDLTHGNGRRYNDKNVLELERGKKQSFRRSNAADVKNVTG